ncbi:helix-turn-helix transcriptional regulator [Methylobacterium oxalidis]|uniref:helix-turn-helix transcriptional regulator n=1 Tax=Methylobacterium oxalidis TaxID=944322 RepID=UPI0033156ABA
MTIMPNSSKASSGNFDGLSARHVRAARTLLDWTQDDLAARAELVRRTIVAIEADGGTPRATTLTAIVRAFSDAGVEFEHGGDGRLRIVDAIRETAGARPRPDLARAEGIQPVGEGRASAAEGSVRIVGRCEAAFGSAAMARGPRR